MKKIYVLGTNVLIHDSNLGYNAREIDVRKSINDIQFG